MPQVRPGNQNGSSFSKGLGKLSNTNVAPRNAARTAKKIAKGELRMDPTAVKRINTQQKEAKKAGSKATSYKVTSSTMRPGQKSVSARKPSVPVKGKKASPKK